MKSDNYITPEKKARWGFGGSKSKVTIGSKPKDEGETKEAESNLTKAQIQEQLKAEGIEFDASANKAELQALLDDSQGD